MSSSAGFEAELDHLHNEHLSAACHRPLATETTPEDSEGNPPARESRRVGLSPSEAAGGQGPPSVPQRPVHGTSRPPTNAGE